MHSWFAPIRAVAAAAALSVVALSPVAAQNSTDTVTYVDAFGDAQLTGFKAQVVTTNKMESQVVVKTPNQNEYAVPVPESFPLDQVRENQFLTVQHLQGVILDVEKSKADEAGVTYDLDVDIDDSDSQMPSGLVTRNVALTAKVLGVSHSDGTVTFEAPSGEKQTVKVQQPDLLKDLDIKTGDFVVLTFYDAVGLEISNT
ncbi:hypothetical protein [Amorphus orientalis]|uniref:Uncharacterized protein n=1 Tax=Amorphus orientalis TaxID=649198 RepID=A0AAE4AU18_9HYPH|nr:hypothetical protein [Amorphus orientalis]MDQ0316707.1 hypothetical protein [Amorphus orientalis]